MNGRRWKVENGVSYRAAGEAMRARLERVAADTDLTIAERLVAAAVTILVGSFSRLADRLTVSDLIRYTGLSERTVQRALVRLARRGHISRTFAPNGVHLGALVHLEPPSPVTPVPPPGVTGVGDGTPVTRDAPPPSPVTPEPPSPVTPSEKDRGPREDTPFKKGENIEIAALSDALADALGHQPATRDERAHWNNAVGQLREAAATPDDVPRRVRVFRRRWPDVEPTPAAIARYWGSLAPRRIPPPPPVAVPPEPDDAPATPDEARKGSRNCAESPEETPRDPAPPTGPRSPTTRTPALASWSRQVSERRSP